MISRPPQWPGGKKCAVCICFDCDADSLIHTMYPDEHQNHATTVSWLQYDQVAVPRIVQLYERLEIRQTFFVPAWCLERYPEAFAPVVEAGHEIGHHGYIHESPNLQTPEGEAFWFQKALAVIEAFTGQRPAGYRAPWGHLSQATLEMVAAEGMLYDSSLLNDENPYILETRKGDIVEMASDWATVEDWSQYTHMPSMGYMVSPRPPDVAAAVYLAEFEAAYEAGSVFIATFHPMVTGRPSRLRRLAAMLEYMQAKGDVWFAPLQDIARHVAQASRDGEDIRRVEWPFYPAGRIPELTESFAGPDLAIRKTV
jgi:peptidoglycan/xylan/chitin deacetylase (PgdA/CDA1 family)